MKKLWNKVLSIGVTTALSGQAQKRVEMLNSISAMVGLVYFMYILGSIFLEIWVLLPFNVLGFTCFLLPLLLNQQRLYQTAKWFFCLGVTLFFAICSLAFGKELGMHYALLVIGIMPLFFFRKRAVILFLFFLSLACFILSLVYYEFFDALVVIETHYFLYINVLVIFCVCFLFVSLFVRDYQRSEGQLLGYTSELEAKNRVLNEAKKELQDAYKDMVTAENEIRTSNTELRQAKLELEEVLSGEREKKLALEAQEQALRVKNQELEKSEKEMRKYLEELLHINENLEHTKEHFEQLFIDKSKDRDNLKWANEQLKKAQTQLIQAEKMSSLGQLTAGIAHEINNPINFVFAGVEVMEDIMRDMIAVLSQYEDLEQIKEDAKLKAALADIHDLKKEIQYEELMTEMHTTLADIKIGADRTAEIVRGLRNFSRTDEQVSRYANVHDSIDATFTILNTKLKDRIGVVKMYDPNMPVIECFPGQLNQVFMNLLSNAIQAIEGEGEISVTTRVLEEEIEIMVSDNGSGMNTETQQKIFEPFFTTKDVGMGTGLGLSISYGIIEKHSGTIHVVSKEGVGTQFIIKLPYRL